ALGASRATAAAGRFRAGAFLAAPAGAARPAAAVARAAFDRVVRDAARLLLPGLPGGDLYRWALSRLCREAQARRGVYGLPGGPWLYRYSFCTGRELGREDCPVPAYFWEDLGVRCPRVDRETAR